MSLLEGMTDNVQPQSFHLGILSFISISDKHGRGLLLGLPPAKLGGLADGGWLRACDGRYMGKLPHTSMYVTYTITQHYI